MKGEADGVFVRMRIDTPTEARIYVKRSASEGSLAFRATLQNAHYVSEHSDRAMIELSESVERSGIAGMAPDENNAEADVA